MSQETTLDKLLFTCAVNSDISALKDLNTFIKEQKYKNYLMDVDTSVAITDFTKFNKVGNVCISFVTPVPYTPLLAATTDPACTQFFKIPSWSLVGLLISSKKDQTTIIPIMQVTKPEQAVFVDLPRVVTCSESFDINIDVLNPMYLQFYKQKIDDLKEEERQAIYVAAKNDYPLVGESSLISYAYASILNVEASVTTEVVSAKAPRVKLKNNKIHKVYAWGRVGYTRLARNK